MKKIIFVLIVGLSLVGTACKDKSAATQNVLPLQEHKEQPRAATSQHIGTREIPGDVRSRCPGYKNITSADKSTPEGVIFKAYQAVLANNLPAFIACFDPIKNPTEIKRYYWKNVKKYIGKYTKSKENASFSVCSEEKHGADRVKIFIVSKDPKKSHPPIIVKKIDGQWKITFFTP